MKILVNFASRSRPEKWYRCITQMLELSELEATVFYVSVDNDDEHISQYNHRYRELVGFDHADGFGRYFHRVMFDRGSSDSKVHAINRVCTRIGGNDDPIDCEIIINTSDDMDWHGQGWDRIIAEDMAEHYPDTDGLLHYPDGFVQERLVTLSIMGRKYYERFGYIYHPDYKSLWCDNEQHEVADLLGRRTYIDKDLYRHSHPANIGGPSDDQYKRMEGYYHEDNATFKRRKYELNFDL